MSLSAVRQPIPAPEEHILTVREALEPLYMQLEEEAEIKLVAAALQAGWSANEAVAAFDELRKSELREVDEDG